MLSTKVIIEVTPAGLFPFVNVLAIACELLHRLMASSAYLYVFLLIYCLYFEGASPGWQLTPFFIIMSIYYKLLIRL
jgi:hypothetical protein